MKQTIDLSTIVGIPQDLFLSPLTDQDLRRRRRRWQGGTAVALLAIFAGLAVGYQQWEDKVERDKLAEADLLARQALLCPGLNDVAGPGYALSMLDGECIGWTTEQRYFDTEPSLQPVVDDIIAENVRVAALRGPGRPYVRLAVLMPMTSRGDGSAMTTTTIKHALQGLYTAQLRANSDDEDSIRGGKPKIQLVLANEGHDESHWETVEGQLAGLARADQHPVVAATGLAISIPATMDAAKKLGEDGIPSVAAVVTATNVVAEKLFKVSPSNLGHTEKLKQYVDVTPALRRGKGFLVFDRNDDNYVATLKAAFIESFPELQHGRSRNSRSFRGLINDETGVPDRFYRIAQDICNAGSNVIYFAGRDADLGKLIHALEGVACKDPQPITILSGATGLSRIQQDLDLQKGMRKHRITVVFASTTAPDRWTQGKDAPPGYPVFERVFRKAGYGLTDLEDGYAIMHYDAGLVAAGVIQSKSEDLRGNQPLTGELVNDELLNAHGSGAVQGASGEVSLGVDPDGWPDGKTLSIVTIPQAAPPSKR